MSIKKTRNNIILGYSELKGGFAPTDHGEFATVGDAERFALENIKSLKWVVANETTRATKDNGEEVNYTYLTKPYSRRGGFSFEE